MLIGSSDHTQKYVNKSACNGDKQSTTFFQTSIQSDTFFIDISDLYKLPPRGS